MSSRTKHPDEKYRNGSITKGAMVLEALEGTSFEPISSQRIIERTQLPRDTVDRALKTFRLLGYAIQNDRDEWSIGPRFVRLAIAVARNKGV